MKKKILAVMLAGAMLLSGCGMSAEVVVNEDGTYTEKSKMYLTEDEIAQMSALDETGESEYSASKASGTVVRDGVTYYVFDDQGEEQSSELSESLGESTTVYTKGGFFMDLTLEDEEATEYAAQIYDSFEFIDVAITFPEEMSVANVKLSDDKKTVYLTKEDYKKSGKLYAFSENCLAEDKTAPTVDGVANNKTYKKPVYAYLSDNATGIKSAKLDGKNYVAGATIKKKGNHKLVVTDFAGNTTTVKFKIEKKAKNKKK